MQRNLNRRMEILFPIERPELQKRLKDILAMMLADNEKSRILQPDGTYQRVTVDKGVPRISAQKFFLESAQERTSHTDTIPDPFQG